METIVDYVCYIVLLLFITPLYQTISSSIADTSGLKSNKNSPTMKPSEYQMLHTKNDEISILCEGDEPMYWSYPTLENFHNFGSRIEIKNTHTEIYESNLIVYNATYADTGFYRCIYNRSQITGDDDENSKSTYVYVYDPKHLLAYCGRPFFNVYELNTTVMSWCKPTSPNITVGIMLEGKTIVNSTNYSSPFSYDPRYGFTVENIYENIEEGTYNCKATEFSRIDYKMLQVILSGRPFVSIKTEKEFYKPNESVLIECHISTNRPTNAQLKWKNHTITKENFKSNTVLLYNTTIIQTSEVFCTAGNTHGPRDQSLKIYVTDLDKGCDLWSSPNNTFAYEGGHFILECGSTKEKYGNKIQWHFNNNPLNISQQSKDYIIYNYDTSYSHRSLLININVKYANAGNYECRIEDQPESCGRIDVDVHGKPLLSCPNFDPKKMYKYDEKIEFNCRAESNPSPSDINCIYETADGTDEISINSTEIDPQIVTFHFTLLLNSSGKIHCNATNKIGTSEISLDVNIAFGPQVLILNESYEYENNTMMTVRCIILSRSPIESIDWYFIQNDSTETKLNESLYTSTACSTRKDLCKETILKMPAHESGALRCETSSGSEKYSSVHNIRGIEQTDSTYYSSSSSRSSWSWSITEIVLSTLLTLSFIIFPVIIIVLCVKINRIKNQGNEPSSGDGDLNRTFYNSVYDNNDNRNE